MGEEGKTVESCEAGSELEILGVNDRVQLNQVEREFQRRQAEALLREGVSVADTGRLDIRGNLTCGSDVFIDAAPGVENRTVAMPSETNPDVQDGFVVCGDGTTCLYYDMKTFSEPY